MDMQATVLMDNCSKQRDVWLKMRQRTIGSSDISAILGLNPYCSPLQLWAEKTGKVEPKEETAPMWLGRALEEIVGAYYARTERKTVVRPDSLFAHPVHSWATASPDFFEVELDEQRIFQSLDPNEPSSFNVKVSAIVEAKTAKLYQLPVWEEGIPDHAHLQTIWQMGVLGIPNACVAALIANDSEKFFVRPVKFSEAIFETMLEAANTFMGYCQSDTPPPAMQTDLQLLEMLDPVIPDSTRELDSEMLPLVQEYLEVEEKAESAKAALAAYEALKKAKRATIVQCLGDAETGLIAGLKVVNKKVVVEPFQNPGNTHFRFSIKQLSEKEKRKFGIDTPLDLAS